jgi:hypothetical protein
MACEQFHERPAELLAQLLRFDTSNPPGGERECVAWVQRLLEGLGVEVRILAREPERPNLIARISGRGERPPLLLQGIWMSCPRAGNGRMRPSRGSSPKATCGAAGRWT